MRVLEGKAIFEGPRAESFTWDTSGRINDVATETMSRLFAAKMDAEIAGRVELVLGRKLIGGLLDPTVNENLVSQTAKSITAEDILAMGDQIATERPELADYATLYCEVMILPAMQTQESRESNAS